MAVGFGSKSNNGDKPQSKAESDSLGVAEVCKAHGIGRSAVYNAINNGKLKAAKDAGGKWWINPRHAKALWGEQRGSPRQNSAEPDDYKAKKIEYEAKLRELKFLQESGELIRREDIEAALSEATESLRSRLQGFGRTHSEGCPERAQRLQAAIEAILRDYSDATAEAYRAARDGEE